MHVYLPIPPCDKWCQKYLDSTLGTKDVVDQLTRRFADNDIAYQILKVEKRDGMRKTQSLDKGSTKC